MGEACEKASGEESGEGMKIGDEESDILLIGEMVKGSEVKSF